MDGEVAVEVDPEGVRASDRPCVELVGVAEGEFVLFIEVSSEARYRCGFRI